MPSRRRLSSVCQSIAHHAASSLSYVHPHLLQALKATGELIATVDLLSATPYPKELLSHLWREGRSEWRGGGRVVPQC